MTYGRLRLRHPGTPRGMARSNCYGVIRMSLMPKTPHKKVSVYKREVPERPPVIVIE